MTRTSRLWAVLGMNVILVGALVVVGVSSGSLGVWAEGIDYLADAAAIGLALAALRWERHSTRRRASLWAAGVNAGWLFAMSVAVAVGALLRLTGTTRHVHGLAVLVASAAAAVVMAIGALILGGDDGDRDDIGADLSVRAVLLDTAADAATATGVALSGLVIWLTGGWFWLDPAVALAISVIVAYHALRLLARICATPPA